MIEDYAWIGEPPHLEYQRPRPDRRRQIRIFNYAFGEKRISITVRDGGMSHCATMRVPPKCSRTEREHRRERMLHDLWRMICLNHGQDPRAPRRFGPLPWVFRRA